MDELSPSEREIDILKILWEKGEASVRDVHAAMSADRECAFTTVQTLLRIMADKGLVSQRSEGRRLFFKAKYSRQRASARFLRKVFDGALDELVLSMLEAERTSPAEMKAIEELISRARQAKKKPGNK
jgi:BlaI family transcriptional regulator, penicillinase repressor